MSLEVDAHFVRTGVWTNIEGGPVLGKTITTDTKTGNLLVALLAVLSTLGTAHLWHLLAFAIHQFRADGRPKDALFRQQQALLRTLPTPSSVVADAIKLCWVWRKTADKPFLRSLLLIVFALSFTAATVAASVFSSLVVDSGTITVLVDSPFCGNINSTGTAWRTYKTALEQVGPVYAKDCYKNGSLPATCNVFMKQNVPLKVENVPCPFTNSTMCDTKDAVSVDSGLLDVGQVFGLNLASSERVQYRKKIECSVLPIEGYYEVVNLTDAPTHWQPTRGALPGEQVVALYYGPTNDLRSMQSYIASLTMSNVTAGPRALAGRTYYTAPDNPSPPGWFPIAGLDAPSGDLFWKPVMGNSILYANPIDDPLYAAHVEVQEFDDTVLANNTRYTSDYRIKGVGCTQQFEICHARNNKDDFCRPLQGFPYHRLNSTDFPDATSVQRAVLQLLIMSASLYPTVGVKTSKAATLMGKNSLTIDSMPQDFWKQEVVGWEQETWAGMQILFSQYAIGPKVSDELADNYWLKPETPGEKTLCTAQKMKKSGGFVNVNVFGMSFIIAFSILAFIVDITLLKFVVYISNCRRRLSPRIDRWIQDGVWQLQRRAYEGEGHRGWTKLESEVPLMDDAPMLKDLPILWVPGKSPDIRHAETFETVRTVNSKHPLQHVETSDEDESFEQRPEPKKSRWALVTFWKR